MAKKTMKKAKIPLKTMNEISAAEAGIMFRKCMGSDVTAYGEFEYIDPQELPDDICARDFLECLQIYRGMHPLYSDDYFVGAIADAASNLTEEQLGKLSPQQKEIVLLLGANRTLQIKEIATTLELADGTVKSQLHDIYRRLGFRGGLEELRTKV